MGTYTATFSKTKPNGISSNPLVQKKLLFRLSRSLPKSKSMPKTKECEGNLLKHFT